MKLLVRSIALPKMADERRVKALTSVDEGWTYDCDWLLGFCLGCSLTTTRPVWTRRKRVGAFQLGVGGGDGRGDGR